MFSQGLTALNDVKFLALLSVSIAAASTVITLAFPLLGKNELERRMRAVSAERGRIRARERERLARESSRVGLRQEPKAYMRQIVRQLGLDKWLAVDNARMILMQAGFRGPHVEVALLFFRFTAPLVFLVGSLLYVLVADHSLAFKGCVVLGSTFFGVKLPELFLSHLRAKRQTSMRRAFPDALDLLLICVESGMSIELAFRRVAQEIGVQSLPLAEEFALATAELSYLPERRAAYENFAARTGLESVKNVCIALIQAEKFGTPLGAALRVLAQESREQRMTLAEKKAAALSPKLTVPMIVCFMPILFIVIIMPAIIQGMNLP